MKRTFIQIYLCSGNYKKDSKKLDERVSDITENIQIKGGDIYSILATSHSGITGAYVIDVLYEDNGNNDEIRQYLDSLSFM